MSTKHEIPPRSYARSSIIQFLVGKESMTFGELQKELNLSRPTMTRHLSALLEDGTLVATKIGREKHYKIKKSAKTKLERKLVLLQSHYKSDFTNELKERDKSSQAINEYKKIGEWINSYFLFLVIRSLQTGDNWIEGFDHRGFSIITSNYLLSILYDSQPAPIQGWALFTKEQLDTHFRDMKKLIKKAKLEKRLSSMNDKLEELYPKNTEFIKLIMKHWIK